MAEARQLYEALLTHVAELSSDVPGIAERRFAVLGVLWPSKRFTEHSLRRMFADFSHDDTAVTLASDLNVDGAYTAQSLPAPTKTVTVDGFEVTRDGLSFAVTRAGKPVKVQPYLGANGHLVALRQGDLAFLHVHPEGGLEFEATFPTAGTYRLFLQFKVDGKVHTAAFTREVER